jgi:hypothetical protein
MNPLLHAGAAKIDITPPNGTQLAGFVGKYRPSQRVLDPLFARVAIFENAGRKICFVALDVTIVNRPYTDTIRRAANEHASIAPDAVLVHATQTHNAPSLGGCQFGEGFSLPREWDWLNFHNEEYSQNTISKIVEAIRVANENLRPVEIGVGSAIDGRWAFNRRAVMRDGKVSMPSHTPPTSRGWVQMKYLEGPIDPEVGVLAARSRAGNLVTALLNYACHPVHLFTQPGGFVSADWCGALCDAFAAATDETSIPLLLNGCCGNLNPWNPFDPDYREDHVAMGKGLASSARKTLGAMEWQDDAVLDWRVQTISIPYRHIPKDRLDAAQEYLSTHPLPQLVDDEKTRVDCDWMRQALIASAGIEKTQRSAMDYEIQVLRLGNAAFVALPGEPFIEGQLQIKLQSPTEHTFVIHCASHYAGYIPISEAIERGGHEVESGPWSKLAPEALETIVAKSGEMLREMFNA